MNMERRREAQIGHSFNKDLERRNWRNRNGWRFGLKNMTWVWIEEKIARK